MGVGFGGVAAREPLQMEVHVTGKQLILLLLLLLCLDVQRFELELEFVQSLANPQYLTCEFYYYYIIIVVLMVVLGQRGYFKEKSFVNYLKYLQYWKTKEYSHFLKYEMTLR